MYKVRDNKLKSGIVSRKLGLMLGDKTSLSNKNECFEF